MQPDTCVRRLTRSIAPNRAASSPAAKELFNACAAHGGFAWDHSALVRALETLANFEIGQATSPR